MKTRIRHKKSKTVRTTISLPEQVYQLSVPKAANESDMQNTGWGRMLPWINSISGAVSGVRSAVFGK